MRDMERERLLEKILFQIKQMDVQELQALISYLSSSDVAKLLKKGEGKSRG